MVKAINEWEDLTEKLHNIVKQLSHEGIVSLNVFHNLLLLVWYYENRIKCSARILFYFQSLSPGGVPLIWICFPL